MQIKKEGHHHEEKEDERKKKKMKEDDGKKNKEKMKEKAEGSKNKEVEKDEEEDDGTVFEGGAFIAVKITEENATFEFIASGQKYPIENVENELTNWKNNVKEIFENEENRKYMEKEMLEKDFGDPKPLGHIQLKQRKMGY